MARGGGRLISPVFSKYDYERNRWVFGLTGEDYERTRQGYACAECLEDFGGMLLVVCPVCKTPTSLHDHVETPSEWR